MEEFLKLTQIRCFFYEKITYSVADPETGLRFFLHQFKKMEFPFCDICDYKKGRIANLSPFSSIAVFGSRIRNPRSGIQFFFSHKQIPVSDFRHAMNEHLLLWSYKLKLV
jgi:hypothetical protein